MNRVLATLLRLLGFKSGPEDFPYSPSLSVGALVAFAVTGLLALSPAFALADAIPQVALELALMTTLLYAMLAVFKRQRRFLQSLTALALVGATMQLLSWPVMRLVYADGEPERIGALPTLALLGLLFWNLALIAHILRRALDISQLQAAAATLAYYVALTVIALSVFGGQDIG
jgi:hypothetical protein